MGNYVVTTIRLVEEVMGMWACPACNNVVQFLMTESFCLGVCPLHRVLVVGAEGPGEQW